MTQRAFFRTLLFIIFPLFAYAEIVDLPSDCVLADSFFPNYENTPAEPRSDSQNSEPVPKPTYLEVMPSSLVGEQVNAISGDLVESQVDLFLPGPKPLVVQRNWDGQQKRWHFGHFSCLRLRSGLFSPQPKGHYIDDAGSMISLNLETRSKALKVPISKFRKGLTNCGSGEISGQTNWKNIAVYAVFQKGKFKHWLRYGTGVERFFDYHKENHHDMWCFRLTEEHHPGSVRFLYGYQGKDLQKIECFDADQNLLQELDIKRVRCRQQHRRKLRPQMRKRGDSFANDPKKGRRNLL